MKRQFLMKDVKLEILYYLCSGVHEKVERQTLLSVELKINNAYNDRSTYQIKKVIEKDLEERRNDEQYSTLEVRQV